MNNLVGSLDSSAWIEVFHKGENTNHFQGLASQPERLVVSVITLYEIQKYCLHTKPDSADAIIATLKLGHVVPVDAEIALRAATLSYEKKIPLADALIYITARLNQCILWSQDSHHQNLEGVRYFPKK
jgi:toxin FitB